MKSGTTVMFDLEAKHEQAHGDSPGAEPPVRRYFAGLSESRPWGKWSVLDAGTGYCVKTITVIPGQRLSLQYHHHRAEQWTVVAGAGIAEIDGEVHELRSGQSVTVPRGAVHRLANRGKQTLVVIEVQTGQLLDESDIVRLKDDYGRIRPLDPS